MPVRGAYRMPMLAVVLLSMIAVPCGGPATLHGQHPTFRAGIDVVVLNVTVTDHGDRYLTDLAEEDFLVFENGRRQQLTFFRQLGPPLSLTLLLDMSSSMRYVLPLVQEAATGFVRTLGSADVASVIAFGDGVRVLQDFTSDRQALETAIHRTNARGATALYNAVYVALKQLEQSRPAGGGEPRRRTLVVLSDGDDTASVVGLDQVLALAAHADTAIYPIALGRRRLTARGTQQDSAFVLRRLAEQTGGRAFFPRTGGDLTDVYAQIREELASQYAIAYQSDDLRKDGLFRRIQVQVGRPGAVARTRAGYFAHPRNHDATPPR